MIGGAGTQHFTFEAVDARFSRASSELGRWLIQIWSCASTVMPPMVPMIQLLGSVCGQVGSTSNLGTVWAAAGASMASAAKQRSDRLLVIRGIGILPLCQPRDDILPMWVRTPDFGEAIGPAEWPQPGEPGCTCPEFLGTSAVPAFRAAS